jgi:endonuclease-3
MTLTNKRQRAKLIIKTLTQKFPDPVCALEHQNPWQLLVATILSAQCTDARVNMVTPKLFATYPSPEALAKAPIKKLEELIHSTGFYRNKAKNIKACMTAIMEKYAGVVPATLDELVALPGVGRKTANVVLGTSFNKAEGVVVDTHVSRLSQRMGLTEASNPIAIEKDLIKLIPKKSWVVFSHLLILQGRSTCPARKPRCEDCELTMLCPKLPYS